MPMIRPLLLCLVLTAPWCVASERLSIQLSGGYTELDGFAEFDATVSPIIVNPFNPEQTVEIDPIDVDLSLPYDTEEVSWEITASYRFWKNLHVQGGYVDLGNFHSEPLLVATPMFFGVIPPPLSGDFPPPVFGIRPGRAIVINPDSPVLAAPPTLTPSRVSLDAHAWLLGLKADHDVTRRVNVYARAAALRAEFDTRSDFGPLFEIHDPSSRTGWAWGVGAQYQIFPRVAVGAAYSQYDVKLHKLDSYQLTLAFGLL